MSTHEQLIDDRTPSLTGGYTTADSTPVDLRVVLDKLKDIQEACTGESNGYCLYEGLIAFCLEDSSIYTFTRDGEDVMHANKLEYITSAEIVEDNLELTKSSGDKITLTLPTNSTSSSSSCIIRSVNGNTDKDVGYNIVAPLLPGIGDGPDPNCVCVWAESNKNKRPITEPTWKSLWDLTKPGDEQQKIYHDDGVLTE